MVMEGLGEPKPLFLDLESPSDLAKLMDPEAFLASQAGRLVCLDEIQRVPDLFPVLRVLIDQNRRPGRFLLLGSASRELIRQSSESLAGRVRYLELTPFLPDEGHGKSDRDLWLRGGFPNSLLAPTEDGSYEWRLDFIRDVLERDVPGLMPKVSVAGVQRLCQMMAHLHGQLLNMAGLGNSLAISGHTVRHHLDLLEGAFVLRRLPPFHANLAKRLVKSPKVYYRDSGILHAMLGIRTWEDLAGHPVHGTSWEGFCMEAILAHCQRGVEHAFYRTARGAEVDLVLTRGREKLAIEFKSSSAPKPRPGFWSGCEDLACSRRWIVAPVGERFPYRDAMVSPLRDFLSAPENADFLRTHAANP
jgi:hypothetical protein